MSLLYSESLARLKVAIQRGKEPRQGGPWGLLPWHRSSRGMWSRNETRCKRRGGGAGGEEGNMYCVSSLRLAVCLRSLFPFDQRRGVCAEDNKLQLSVLVNQGLPNTRWHRSARVFFKSLWWEWISPLMVYICIVENHRAPVRMTWLLDDECLFSKCVIHTEGYYFTKSSFPYRIAHVQTESSIFGEIRNLLSKTFLFSLCEQSQMFLRNAGWENTTNGNFSACSIEALESDIVFCLWFFFNNNNNNKNGTRSEARRYYGMTITVKRMKKKKIVSATVHVYSNYCNIVKIPKVIFFFLEVEHF